MTVSFNSLKILLTSSFISDGIWCSISSQFFNQNIEHNGRHWIEHSKCMYAKNKWSHHLIYTYRVYWNSSQSCSILSLWQSYLTFNTLHQERNRIKERVSIEFCINTSSCDRSHFIYRHWACKLFSKTLWVIFLPSNVYWPQMHPCIYIGYAPMDLYILLVNNYINI